jgi:hypothetical protein
MLVMVTMLCVALGGTRLIRQSEYLECNTAECNRGERIELQGRIIRFFDSRDAHLEFYFAPPRGKGGSRWTYPFIAQSSGFFNYNFTMWIDAPGDRGEYELFVRAVGERVGQPSTALVVK